ncbi:MAG: type II secretion system protein [Acidobacteriota bacterium]
MKNSKESALFSSKMPYLVKDRVTKNVTADARGACSDPKKLRIIREAGFSLIELLLVVVTIGVIAAIAVPRLQQTIRAAENANTFATLRTISSTQVGYRSQHDRYGRLSELNNIMTGSLGTPSGNDIIRGKYLLEMTPAAPTDAELKLGYTVTATRNVANETIIYVYELTESGEIRQILP